MTFIVAFDEHERLTFEAWLREAGYDKVGLVERVAHPFRSEHRPDPRRPELEAAYGAWLADRGLVDGEATRQQLYAFGRLFKASLPAVTTQELARRAFEEGEA